MNARPIVRDAKPHAIGIEAFRRDVHAAAATGQRIETVLDEHLECPFEQHLVALDRERLVAA